MRVRREVLGQRKGYLPFIPFSYLLIAVNEHQMFSARRLRDYSHCMVSLISHVYGCIAKWTLTKFSGALRNLADAWRVNLQLSFKQANSKFMVRSLALVLSQTLSCYRGLQFEFVPKASAKMVNINVILVSIYARENSLIISFLNNVCLKIVFNSY